MRKIPVFAVLLGLLAFSAQPAHAYPSEHIGECHMIAVRDTLAGPNAYYGVIVGVIAVYDTANVANPTNANVSCYVRVNGVPYGDSVVASGTGIILFPTTTSFDARPTDHVEVCTEIYYYDGSPPFAACRTAARIAGGAVFGPVAVVKYTIDPVLCQVLAIVRGVPGVLETDPEGDVYLTGNRIYDCPPYEGTSVSVDLIEVTVYVA